MSRGGVTWEKQSDPRELITLLWMTLACGAAGTMFWQYRPEYLSFESPGYNLVALDGEPTPRFDAAAHAIAQIEGLAEHLPLECPRADVGIVYHPESQELFSYNGESDRFLAGSTWRVPDALDPRHRCGGHHTPDGLGGIPTPLSAQRHTDECGNTGTDRTNTPRKPRNTFRSRGKLRHVFRRWTVQLPSARRVRRPVRYASRRLFSGNTARHQMWTQRCRNPLRASDYSDPMRICYPRTAPTIPYPSRLWEATP